MLKEKKNVWCLLGMLVGLAAIIVGIVIASHSYSGYSDYEYLQDASFGADFYTYIYDATRYAANNTKAIVSGVRSLHELGAMVFGCLFILGGLVDICAFGSKITLAKKEIAEDATEAPATEPEATAVEEEEIPAEENFTEETTEE